MGPSGQQRRVLSVPGEGQDPKDLTVIVEEALVNLWLLPVSLALYFLPALPVAAWPFSNYHGSRTPVGTKIRGCSSPLYKTVLYLHIPMHILLCSLNCL